MAEEHSVEWYLEVLKKYADFSGRARRKEYWMFILINMLISIAIGFVAGFVGGALGLSSNMSMALALLYSVAVFVPSLAVSVRRLHDTGRSGWWLLIVLVPILGGLALLVFAVQDSQPGSNQYGNNPKMAMA